ncbi:hypothetical protein PS652_02216 [Pseudomonas fluorescens]|uniref:Uncharacterized protein n=1 Tax=Pseudomonas fluorescens TaxID=294 RepID=A0A5E6XPN1_PSEFL|nr:hypothetical protein PS652_05485 [Pseudomonas fluorescens]
MRAAAFVVRRFLPDLLKHIRFGFGPAGKGVGASLDWLQLNLPRRKPEDDAPQEIMAKAWQQHITREDGTLDMGAYVFCTLDALRTALRRRDVFASPSWRYADPRIGLLDGAGLKPNGTEIYAKVRRPVPRAVFNLEQSSIKLLKLDQHGYNYHPSEGDDHHRHINDQKTFQIWREVFKIAWIQLTDVK